MYMNYTWIKIEIITFYSLIIASIFYLMLSSIFGVKPNSLFLDISKSYDVDFLD